MTVGRCPARRRDGRICGALAATPEAQFCARHEQLIKQLGESAVLEGRYPKRRAVVVQQAEPNRQTPKGHAQLPLDAKTKPARWQDTEGKPADPGSIRPRLAAVAAANQDGISQALLDAALGATREHWVTHTCLDCGKKQRLQVQVPDVRSRVAAIEVWLREGLGRTREAEQPTPPQVPTTTRAAKSMTWEDMQYLATTLFVDEFETLAHEGGEALVRERISKLSDRDRCVLRQALDTAAV